MGLEKWVFSAMENGIHGKLFVRESRGVIYRGRVDKACRRERFV